MAPRQSTEKPFNIRFLSFLLLTTFSPVYTNNCPRICVCSGSFSNVYCGDSNLTKVPNRIPERVVYLNLHSNNISKLIKNQFANLPQLHTLQLSANTISEIDNDAFVGLDNLQILELFYNSLVVVPSGALKSLINLKELWLGGNPIVCLDAYSFSYLPNLKLLDLGELRQLRGISNNAFAGLSSLVYLNMGVANLQTVPYLQHLTSLEELNLSGNIIRVLGRTSFQSMFRLRRLMIISSQVNEVEPLAFEDLQALSELDLSYNNLSTLPYNLFAASTSLGKVNLKYNPWNCSCDITWLVEWLRTKVRDRTCDACGECRYPKRLLGTSVFRLPIEIFRCPRRKISNYSIQLNVTEGEDASLPCVSGRETAISWITPNGTTIRHGNYEVRVKVFNDGSLNITRVTLHDAGVYRCIARNPGGSQSVITTLNVTTRAYITDIPVLEEPMEDDFDPSVCTLGLDDQSWSNVNLNTTSRLNLTYKPPTMPPGGTVSVDEDDDEYDPLASRKFDHLSVIVSSIAGIVVLGLSVWGICFLCKRCHDRKRFLQKKCKMNERTKKKHEDDSSCCCRKYCCCCRHKMEKEPESVEMPPPDIYSIDIKVDIEKQPNGTLKKSKASKVETQV
ncbi:leucine-rich repeat-containing protein 4C-like [Branchiostoma floridae x Branchiostoma belcheri]